MPTLYRFGAKLGLPDASPFVLKVDCFLRMSGIEFDYRSGVQNLKRSPKHKLPMLEDAGKIVADSQFIIEHLKLTRGDRLDAELDEHQLALVYLLTKSLDENLYFILLYSRWIREDSWRQLQPAFFDRMPWILRQFVPRIMRKKIRKTLFAQGTARHSDAELQHIAIQNFNALSKLLGDKSYFLGDRPSSFDATAYGFLAQFILTEFDNPFNRIARSYSNLVNFCQRVKQAYYDDASA